MVIKNCVKFKYVYIFVSIIQLVKLLMSFAIMLQPYQKAWMDDISFWFDIFECVAPMIESSEYCFSYLKHWVRIKLCNPLIIVLDCLIRSMRLR